MYRTTRQTLKHSTPRQFEKLKKITHKAKNLTNRSTYLYRQHYFNHNTKIDSNIVYNQLMKEEVFTSLPPQIANNILKKVDYNFRSFFALKRKAKQGHYNPEKVKLPRYMPRNSYAIIQPYYVIQDNLLSVRLIDYGVKFRNHHMVQAKIPPNVNPNEIIHIKIKPLNNGRKFEIHYVSKLTPTPLNLNHNNTLAIDVGVNNLMTCVTNMGDSFIVDGKKLKSFNQWYNKQMSRLTSIKDHQKIKNQTRQMLNIATKHKNRTRDYMYKATKIVIDYCIKNDIGTIVYGYNINFQRNSKLSKRINQNFVSIPFKKLKNILHNKCEQNGMRFIVQEESYTSKASFWDRDPIPTFKNNNFSGSEPKFSGERIKRGMYKTKDGNEINADVNGALNILRKSKVVNLDNLYDRGYINTPMRIRVI